MRVQMGVHGAHISHTRGVTLPPTRNISVQMGVARRAQISVLQRSVCQIAQI